MVKFIIKRLLWLVPVFALVLLMLFLLDQYTAIEQLDDVVFEQGQQRSDAAERKLFEELAEDKHLKLPPFYLSIHNRGWTSTFYKEVMPRRRKLLHAISHLTFDTTATKMIVSHFEALSDQIRFENRYSNTKWKSLITDYNRNESFDEVWKNIAHFNVGATESVQFSSLKSEIERSKAARRIWDALPQIKWNGTSNRFHKFLNAYLFAGTKRSAVDGRTVYTKIWPAAGITLFINLLSLIIILMIGVPVGTWLFRSKNGVGQSIVNFVLYVLFALPMFWIATFILIAAGWLPVGGLTGTPILKAGEIPSILTFLRPSNLSYLLLPIISISLALVAFIAIHVDRTLKETDEEKFILAARTKGLTEQYIVNKHNRPVSFYTILTLVGNSIPALISGSIVIEIIFNLPGMGRLLWQALYAFDWNVVHGILLLGVVFSVIGQLVTDIAYYYINPASRANS